ncbi:MAG: glycosyltransferase family protein [Armatimonadota bacterium]
MRLQIICKGSTNEGLGHLFRAKIFAGAASRTHDTQLVAIADESVRSVLDDTPCQVKFVESDECTLPLVEGFRPNVLAYDLTRIDDPTFRSSVLAADVTASLSPVFDHASDVDILFTRVSRQSPIPGVRIYKGLEYAILGNNCQVIGDDTYQRVLSRPDLQIAVSMGGGDAPNKTLAVVTKLLELDSPTTIWVMLGEGYAHSYQALADAAHGNAKHEVILAKTNRSMWSVMSNCALAVLGGGLTTVEAVYAGIPSINVLDRPEQTEILQDFIESGVCRIAGKFSEDALQVLLDTVSRLGANRSELQQMRDLSRNLVDDQGCERVLRVLEDSVAAASREKLGQDSFASSASS